MNRDVRRSERFGEDLPQRAIIVSRDAERRTRLSDRLSSCVPHVEIIDSASQINSRSPVKIKRFILFAPYSTFVNDLAALEAEVLSLFRIQSAETAVSALTLKPGSLVALLSRALGLSSLIDSNSLNLCNAMQKIWALPRRAHSIEPHAHEEKRLTDREAAILIALRAGLSLKEIAKNLQISPNTVSTYKTRIMAKLHRESNADLLSDMAPKRR